MTATMRTPVLPLLLTPEQTAKLLGLTLDELRAQREAEGGPTYHRIGLDEVRYSTASVMQWRSSIAP